MEKKNKKKKNTHKHTTHQYFEKRQQQKQNRAKQGKTGQNRAKQGKTGQNRAKQGKTGQNRAQKANNTGGQSLYSLLLPSPSLAATTAATTPPARASLRNAASAEHQNNPSSSLRHDIYMSCSYIYLLLPFLFLGQNLGFKPINCREVSPTPPQPPQTTSHPSLHCSNKPPHPTPSLKISLGDIPTNSSLPPAFLLPPSRGVSQCEGAWRGE